MPNFEMAFFFKKMFSHIFSVTSPVEQDEQLTQQKFQSLGTGNFKDFRGLSIIYSFLHCHTFAPNPKQKVSVTRSNKASSTLSHFCTKVLHVVWCESVVRKFCTEVLHQAQHKLGVKVQTTCKTFVQKCCAKLSCKSVIV